MNTLPGGYNSPNYSPVTLPNDLNTLAGYGNPNYSPVSVPSALAPQNATQVAVTQPLATEGNLWGNLDWDNILGTAPAAIQGISSLANAFIGMKQYGLAKDQFEQSKREFNLNYEANKNLTNSRLEDRQRARVASNPTAYQSVGEYIDKYGVK